MSAVQIVQSFLDAFQCAAPRDAFVSDGFRLVGEGFGAPVLAFAVEGASARDLVARGMQITFEQVVGSSGEHVLVWGTWSGDDARATTYHVVLRVQHEQITEARFFGDMEQARWFAGV